MGLLLFRPQGRLSVCGFWPPGPERAVDYFASALACSRQSEIWSALNGMASSMRAMSASRERGNLGKGGDALLVELTGCDRADALDLGQIVRLAGGCGEQRCCGCGCFGLGRSFCLGCSFLLRRSLLRRLGATGQDVGDLDDGLVLTVTANALGVLAAALLEGDDLAGAALLDHFGNDHGAIDEGCANGCAGAFADHENLVELDGVAGGALELLDRQNVIGGDAVLLATGFDDCEHLLSFRVRPALASRRAVFLPVGTNRPGPSVDTAG
jgi:hypothetical protein